MQSIIDKLQSPQSFNQSIQELIIALQRTQDPANLIVLKDHLERLAKIESSTSTDTTTVQTNGTAIGEESKDIEKESKEPIPYPTYEELAEILESCKVITFRLVEFLKQYNTLFSNVFRFSRNTNFNSTGKFKNNGKPFNSTAIKSKSPTNEDATTVNKQLDANLFNQNSLNTNCKTVQSTSHTTVSVGTALNTGLNSTFVNTANKLDYSTTNSISSINSLNSLNKLNKLKPCAYVPPTVLQNGSLNGTSLNSTIKTNGTSTFNQANYLNGNSKVSNKSAFNGQLNGSKQSSTSISTKVNGLMNGNLTNGHLTNGSLTNGNLSNGNLISLSTSGSLTTNSTNTKTDYLSNLKMDAKARVHSSITNENQQNNQQQIKTGQLASPIKQELFDSHLNHRNQLLQSKPKNGYKKSNPNSFSFDDADDQFIPFADDQPKISKFGPISRTMNLINTQTVTGSSNIGLKNDNLTGLSICKNTDVILGVLPALIRPFNTLFISNEPCVKK